MRRFSIWHLGENAPRGRTPYELNDAALLAFIWIPVLIGALMSILILKTM